MASDRHFNECAVLSTHYFRNLDDMFSMCNYKTNNKKHNLLKGNLQREGWVNQKRKMNYLSNHEESTITTKWQLHWSCLFFYNLFYKLVYFLNCTPSQLTWNSKPVNMWDLYFTELLFFVLFRKCPMAFKRVTDYSIIINTILFKFLVIMEWVNSKKKGSQISDSRFSKFEVNLLKLVGLLLIYKLKFVSLRRPKTVDI